MRCLVAFLAAFLVATAARAAPSDELAALFAPVAERLGASEPRDAGGVIREVLAEVAGGADGGRVAAMVREILSAN
jgi:uncharacterized protein YqeY